MALANPTYTYPPTLPTALSVAKAAKQWISPEWLLRRGAL